MTQRRLSIIAGALLLLSLTGNVWWIAGSGSVQGDDTAHHLYFSVVKGRPVLRAPLYRAPVDAARLIVDSPPKSSPLVYLVTTSFYRVFGTGHTVARMSNWFFMAILLWTVFLHGRRLHSPGAGIAAASVTALFPLVFGGFRQYGLDFPLAAMVSLAVWLLIKTDRFSRRAYCILTGIAAGAGILVKPQFMLVFPLPFAAAMAGALTDTDERAVRMRNAGTVLALAALVSAPWWAPQVRDIIGFYRLHRDDTARIVTDRARPFYEKLYLLFEKLGMHSIGLPALAASLAGIAAFFSRRRDYERRMYLHWFLSPFLAIAFLFWFPIQRYFIPSLPALALMTVVGLMEMRRRVLGRTLLYSLLGYLGVQYAVQTFAPGEFAKYRFPAYLDHGERMRREGDLTAWVFGWTEFFDLRRRDGGQRLEELETLVAPHIDPSRRNYMVWLPLAGPVNEFLLPYYFESRHPGIHCAEFSSLSSEVSRMYRDIDIIVFDLPPAAADRGWPPLPELARMLDTSVSAPVRQHLEQTVDVGRYLRDISRLRGDFVRVGQTPGPAGRVRVVYARRGGPAAAVRTGS